MKQLLRITRKLRRLTNYIVQRAKYLTLKKLINITRAELALRKKQSVLNSYPYEYIIDPTNICQLACPLCMTGGKFSTTERGRMDFETFKKIVDQAAKYAVHIYLHNWGEPLLHRDIVKFISYAKRYRVAVSLSTNLSFDLTEERADEILTSGLNTLVVSIDGATAETYAKYRVKGDFDLVIRNLKMLLARREALGRKKPFIEWQYLTMKHNTQEIGMAKQMSAELGVDNIFFGSIVLPFGDNSAEHARQWFTDDEYDNRIRYDITDRDMQQGACWWLWRAVIFNWDGSTSPCCYMDEEQARFGSIHDASLKEVWNSPSYVAARKMFSTSEKTPGIVCGKCPVSHKRTDRNGNSR